MKESSSAITFSTDKTLKFSCKFCATYSFIIQISGDDGVRKSPYISDVQQYLVLDISIKVCELDCEFKNQHYWATGES